MARHARRLLFRYMILLLVYRNPLGFVHPQIKMESELDIFGVSCYADDMERTLSIRREGSHEKPTGGAARARGIRQEELAEALEVSRQTIGSLENGRYNPSILLAFKIARYFGMTIEEIFLYEEEPS